MLIAATFMLAGIFIIVFACSDGVRLGIRAEVTILHDAPRPIVKGPPVMAIALVTWWGQSTPLYVSRYPGCIWINPAELAKPLPRDVQQRLWELETHAAQAWQDKRRALIESGSRPLSIDEKKVA